MTNIDLIHVVEQQSGNCAGKKKKKKNHEKPVFCLLPGLAFA